MENWELQKVAEELKIGQEITKQLQVYLNTPSASIEIPQLFVQQIYSSFEKALCILNFHSLVRNPVIDPAGFVTGMSKSPAFEHSHFEFKDQGHLNNSSRKRKNLGRWKQRVKVSPGMGLEGPLDDGFCWRKYGQKYILGSQYPRGYYRCTDRACVATKRVQRSDEDPTIFEITYYGNHTCTQLQSPAQLPENQESAGIVPETSPLEIQQGSLLNFQSSLTIIDSSASTTDQPLDQSSFGFPSTMEIVLGDQSRRVFPVHDSSMANSFMGNFSTDQCPGVTDFGF